MKQNLEKEVILPYVTVRLATISWQGIGERPHFPGYSLCQRLSDNHSPLRIGNLATPEMLPRVRSVGFLPAGRSVFLYPLESDLRVLYCFYDADYVERVTQISKDKWERYATSLAALRNQRIEVLMQEIHAELEKPGYGRELLIESVTNMMLVELARYVRKLEKKGSGKGESQPLASWQLRRIEERIQASIELGYPSLGDLAGICGISKEHLARSFKATTGWQIHKYISSERISTAKTMLARNDVSCEEVSSRLGFKSPAYFSTAFRRIAGKTPTEFRKQIRENQTGDLM
ncbi:helix-turn-helix domain-containing protein [Emcibacter nanhaiensis]|uniref:Helix-turn-helix transcriptional regulator n=1 Tax=Emcibacter nanhaiensis TaxID=1505037 RepID=A0A501PUR0_9PROT|nr:AraC family transcriptional regulator [Emcibacter nanhaiensis]TPD63802.1 helix-turn-helix transcriptional regulator [Emcibacter nanhaiensis]